jgi:hypothetical protein
LGVLCKGALIGLTETNDLLLLDRVEDIEVVTHPRDFLFTGGVSLHLGTIFVVRDTKELEFA